VPSTFPTVSRRRVLVGATALALLGTVATACGKPTPRPDVDALVAQFVRARSDNQLAMAAATAARPPVAKVLTTIASERSAHAQALSDELTRMVGTPPAMPSATPATTTTSGAPLPPTSKDVVAALKQSADGAAELAAQVSGYRAGLLGSIAAACTAAYAVALGGGQDT